MSKIIALLPNASAHPLSRQLDLVRGAIVLGCGMALILAGPALPF